MREREHKAGRRARFTDDSHRAPPEGDWVRGRKFTGEDLQTMVLSLLRERPAHGYELIQDIAARTREYYRPSPGMLYPALAHLTDMGLLDVALEGNRKRYALSDAGRAKLAEDAERAEWLFARMAHVARKMERVQRALGADPNVDDDQGWLDEFVEARRALKRALLRKDDADHPEQRRIAAILREAVARIAESSQRSSPSMDRPTASTGADAPAPFTASTHHQDPASMTQTVEYVRRVRHALKFRAVQVTRIQDVTPHLRCITLRGDDLHDFVSASFDDHVKVFFPPDGEERPAMPSMGERGLVFPEGVTIPVRRDYTPRRFDPKAGTLDIEFVLHGDGPAARWAAQARIGNWLGVGGPRGSFVVSDALDWYLLIGDATALPAIGRCVEGLRAGQRALVVAATVDPADRPTWQTAGDVSYHWVAADAHGDAPHLAQTVRSLVLPDGVGHAWAAGESASIKAVRQVLVETHRLDKAMIRASAYWKRGASDAHEALDD